MMLVNSKGFVCMLDRDESIQYNILPFFRVALSIHSFGNDIGHKGGDFEIGKLNVIKAGI